MASWAQVSVNGVLLTQEKDVKPQFPLVKNAPLVRNKKVFITNKALLEHQRRIKEAATQRLAALKDDKVNPKGDQPQESQQSSEEMSEEDSDDEALYNPGA